MECSLHLDAAGRIRQGSFECRLYPSFSLDSEHKTLNQRVVLGCKRHKIAAQFNNMAAPCILMNCGCLCNKDCDNETKMSQRNFSFSCLLNPQLQGCRRCCKKSSLNETIKAVLYSK